MITCDLGSNTLRVLKFNCKTKQRVKEYEKVVRTAHNLYKTGAISQSSIAMIFEALKEAHKLFDFKSDEVYCVTTEAMRRASNSKEILSRIKKEYGLDFKIIDGKEEARLTLLGVESGLEDIGVDTNNYIMMDLGGGSMELSFKLHKSKTLSHSFSFGILTTAQKNGNKIEEISKNLCEDTNAVTHFIKKHHIDLSQYSRFITTAGTPTTVAAFLDGMDYKSYDYTKINGKVLHIKDFDFALKKLLSLDMDKREFWVGTNRSELVTAGILIVKDIMAKVGFKECMVIDNGLREGLAIAKCNTKKIF